MMKRTTVTIRDDLYDILRKEAGKRGISEKINEILAEYFFERKPRKTLFGTMPTTDLSDLRNHVERL